MYRTHFSARAPVRRGLRTALEGALLAYNIYHAVLGVRCKQLRLPVHPSTKRVLETAVMGALPAHHIHHSILSMLRTQLRSSALQPKCRGLKAALVGAPFAGHAYTDKGISSVPDTELPFFGALNPCVGCLKQSSWAHFLDTFTIPSSACCAQNSAFLAPSTPYDRILTHFLCEHLLSSHQSCYPPRAVHKTPPSYVRHPIRNDRRSTPSYASH